MITLENFATQLLKQVPEFQIIYEAHLKENGEILPEPMFSELLFFLFSSGYNQYTVGRIADYIGEVLVSTDSRIIDLVQDLFIETNTLSQITDILKPLLGWEALAIYEAITSRETIPMLSHRGQLTRFETLQLVV